MQALMILIATLLLTSCASLSGNATYRYAHTTQAGDSCEVTVDSGRNLTGGVGVTIGTDCSLKTDVGAATQGRSDLGTALDLVREIKTIAAPALLPNSPAAPTPH